MKQLKYLHLCHQFIIFINDLLKCCKIKIRTENILFFHDLVSFFIFQQFFVQRFITINFYYLHEVVGYLKAIWSFFFFNSYYEHFLFSFVLKFMFSIGTKSHFSMRERMSWMIHKKAYMKELKMTNVSFLHVLCSEMIDHVP